MSPARWQQIADNPRPLHRGPKPLPLEFALRQLVDLDLSGGVVPSAPALQAFVREWGYVNPRFGGADAQVGIFLFADDNKPIRKTRSVAEVEGLEAIWSWLRTAQALVGTWTRWHADDYLLPAWDGLDGGPTDEADVPYWFAWWLDKGLATSTSMRVILGSSKPESPSGSFRPAGVDIYEACCVQLANLIHDGIPPKLCANDSCGRVFVRQVGGAATGRHRTKGTRFCTPQCQRAQAQREYRARRSAARKGTS